MRWSCLEDSKFVVQGRNIVKSTAQDLQRESLMSLRSPTPLSEGYWDVEPSTNSGDGYTDASDDEERQTSLTGKPEDHENTVESVWTGRHAEYRAWSKWSEGFSRHRLTKAIDKPPAFSAVAKQFTAEFLCHLLYELNGPRRLRDRVAFLQTDRRRLSSSFRLYRDRLFFKKK